MQYAVFVLVIAFGVASATRPIRTPGPAPTPVLPRPIPLPGPIVRPGILSTALLTGSAVGQIAAGGVTTGGIGSTLSTKRGGGAALSSGKQNAGIHGFGPGGALSTLTGTADLITPGGGRSTTTGTATSAVVVGGGRSSGNTKVAGTFFSNPNLSTGTLRTKSSAFSPGGSSASSSLNLVSVDP